MDAIEVLNTIQDNTSQAYQDRVPEATRNNLEEIYNNFTKAQTYDQTGAGLLTRHLPDTKVVFHHMSRQDSYVLTDSPESLEKAFKSYEGLAEYLENFYDDKGDFIKKK